MYIALNVLKNRKIFGLGDKLLPVFKHGFLRSEENINLNNFQHMMVYECWCVLQFYGHMMYCDQYHGRCYATWFTGPVADGKPLRFHVTIFDL